MFAVVKSKTQRIHINQKDIGRLVCWARQWGMRFQPVKCNIMQIHVTRKRTTKTDTSYSLAGTLIEM